MSFRILCPAILFLPLAAQMPATRPDSQPIFRVNIIERTTPALNYGHLTEPTKIDFRGTALMSDAHGDATVEARRGAVLIDAHFNHVPPPTRYGPEYLTYVVWAISPEGRPQNLGELVLSGSDKGHLRASAAMQAFALIVTAEPYFSVTTPSDVVVMENRVRPDTTAKVEQVNATYELLPRKPYTYNMAAETANTPAAGGGKAVSMSEYEAVLARYEAQSAIDAAVAAGAPQYAPERLARAQEQLAGAQRMSAKQFGKDVVAAAREAAQTAEDARTIAIRRAGDERAARDHAREEQLSKEADQQRAEAALAAERAQLAAERARLDAERAAMESARLNPPAPIAAPQPQTASADRMRFTSGNDASARANRARLTASLRASFETLDTPRGVVVVIPDSLLESASGVQRVRVLLADAQSSLTAFPGLRFEVDGYADSSAREGSGFTQALAERVRELLGAEGISPPAITARGCGSERPLASNATPAGRERNRRVEVVINGASIGDMPTWQHAYAIKP